MTKNLVTIVKRDGAIELFDIQKIKQSIANAVEQTGVSALELESKLDQFIKTGITTKEIQENIIQHALQLATAQSPEWLDVAGKALAADMWANFDLRKKSFKDIVKYNIQMGAYSKELSMYSDEQLDEIGAIVNNSRDLLHSHSSLVTVKNKYLGKHELNQTMHAVNALRFGQYELPETRMQFVKECYEALSLRKTSLATPFMSNMRQGGNNASCFILAMEDDLTSIFDNIKRAADISKRGGGLGIFIGYLRAKGSSVNGNDNAAGSVTSWCKIINATMVATNQNGKRAGAATVALPLWHADIQDFLDMQSEHGDLRTKSYDIFPQVTVPDLFMQRDKKNAMWTTFCPFEVKQKLGIDVRGLYGDKFEKAYESVEKAFIAGKLKVGSQVKARDLMKIIMRSQFETGLPYMAFIDEMNRRNPNAGNKDSYGIVCANLCCESYSNVMPDTMAHVCSLASVNLANICNLKELASITKLTTKMLEYGLHLTKAPTDITALHLKTFRTIGIGMMGLHDYLAKHHMTYKNLDLISEIAEIIELSAAEESVVLAKRFGTFGAFETSTWKSGKQVNYFKAHSKTRIQQWENLQKNIDKHGIRHSQLTSPAPTTSTSLYQQASATFLPVYSAFFAESNKNGDLLVAAKYLKENPLGYGKTLAKFDAKEIIDIASAIQKFTDTGISMELLFDQNKDNFKAKDLYDAIHYAYESKIKTIYYIRSIKKNATLERAEESCLSCAG